MKPTVVSADVLFEDHRESLKWQWVAGLGASERKFDEVAIREARSGADLVGYLNYINPYRVQVCGEREVTYLTSAVDDDNRRRVSRIVTLEPPVLVVADSQTVPDALMAMCERAQIPMFASPEPAAFVIDVMRAYLRATLPTALPCMACSWTSWAWACSSLVNPAWARASWGWS